MSLQLPKYLVCVCVCERFETENSSEVVPEKGTEFCCDVFSSVAAKLVGNKVEMEDEKNDN